ncbi:SPOCS domain-containing protein [Clostridium paraputrificum]|uniref:SPOCS domain-containing protein n=1 Tax=Clostridium TaxID=1485 RepID=UPI003D327758
MATNCICGNNSLVIQKSVNKEHAIVGDTLKYTATVINEGDTLIENIVVIDTLASELEFKTGSVKLGNIPLPDDNVLSGINIGCLKPGEIKTISFKAKIIERPASCYIKNTTTAKFSHDSNLDSNWSVSDVTSNEVCVRVDIADIEIIKKSNRETASRGDIICYEIKLINVGTLEARNILFIDKLPDEVSLVNDAIEVNGQRINNVGNDIEVYIGTIEAGDCSVVRYKVRVKSSGCKGAIINKAFVKFNYNLCKSSYGEVISRCKEECISEVKLGISTFKQISIDDNLCIPEVKPDIEEINDMKVEAKIVECHVIKTTNNISNEGQILSGYKLIVRGVLKEFIEYTSNTEEQSVHSAHYSIPFSTFIVLPSNFVIGSKIDVEAKVEDVYHKLINCRCFFKNVTLLINAKVMSCEYM